MAFIRVYTDAEGRSRFEDLDMLFQPTNPAEAGAFSQKVTSVTFRRQPVGLVQDWHTAPRRQYVVTLRGLAEIETGSGEVRQFGPGDVLLADDLTGKGHVTRVIGTETRISISIPIVD